MTEAGIRVSFSLPKGPACRRLPPPAAPWRAPLGAGAVCPTARGNGRAGARAGRGGRCSPAGGARPPRSHRAARGAAPGSLPGSLGSAALPLPGRASAPANGSSSAAGGEPRVPGRWRRRPLAAGRGAARARPTPAARVAPGREGPVGSPGSVCWSAVRVLRRAPCAMCGFVCCSTARWAASPERQRVCRAPRPRNHGFRLVGEDFWGHGVQPLTEHLVNHTMALGGTCSLSLNTSGDGDSTASLAAHP